VDKLVRRHICLVYGTRPEAIKLAPVHRELRARSAKFRTTVVVTAQHRQLLDQVLAVFGIKPDVDLDIMEHGQSLSQITCRALQALQETLGDLRPDIVLVQGDTTTVFAGALAAFYESISVGHVEAGLRSGNKFSPYPEEINRRMTGVLADLHFAPTQDAKHKLLAENIAPDSIFVTGNTVIDALRTIAGSSGDVPELTAQLLDRVDEKLVLVTVHRRENLGVGLTAICSALEQLAAEFEDVTIIWPLHPNPAVQDAAWELLGGKQRIVLCEPLDYFDFVPLLSRADLIITDSGGIQEEASALGIPVLVTRDTTERPEGVDAGVARLVGVGTEAIVENATELLTNPSAYARMSRQVCPYGDGLAAERICDALEYHFGMAEQRPPDFDWTES
jgi:UDP-N-acetylglucosamine 2-epimerase (non-hydrolysing)